MFGKEEGLCFLPHLRRGSTPKGSENHFGRALCGNAESGTGDMGPDKAPHRKEKDASAGKQWAITGKKSHDPE